jgi:hypothetical protein
VLLFSPICSFIRMRQTSCIGFSRKFHVLWVRNSCVEGRKVKCFNAIARRDNVSQWLAAGWRFSPGTAVSYTNETYRHDIAEILLKVALNTILFCSNIISNLGRCVLKCLEFDPLFFRNEAYNAQCILFHNTISVI